MDGMAKNSLEHKRDIIISQRKKAKTIEQMAKLNKRLHEVNKKLGFTMETAPKKTYELIKALEHNYKSR